MYELKTCPFCGGYAEFQQTACGTTEGNSVQLSFQVICKKCDATAPKSYGSVKINFSSDGLLNIWQDDRDMSAEYEDYYRWLALAAYNRIKELEAGEDE